jgi:hypothetical protein
MLFRDMFAERMQALAVSPDRLFFFHDCCSFSWFVMVPVFSKTSEFMWMKMSTCIRKVASEEFRVIKGDKRETKET